MADNIPDLSAVDASTRSRLEDLAIAIHSKLADPTVAQRFGRKWLDQHDQARRVIWMHAPSTFERPKQAGPRMVAGVATRTIWYRLEAFEAHIYADSDGDADLLLDYLVAAAALIEPSFVARGYDWQSDQPNQAGETTRTQKIVLRGTFTLPVLDMIKVPRRVQSASSVVGTIQPDDSVLPEPMS